MKAFRLKRKTAFRRIEFYREPLNSLRRFRDVRKGAECFCSANYFGRMEYGFLVLSVHHAAGMIRALYTYRRAISMLYKNGRHLIAMLLSVSFAAGYCRETDTSIFVLKSSRITTVFYGIMDVLPITIGLFNALRIRFGIIYSKANGVGISMPAAVRG